MKAQQRIATRMAQSRKRFARHTTLWRELMRSELDAWQALAHDLAAELVGTLTPRRVERQVLTRVDSLLTTAHTSVARELARIDGPGAAAPPLDGYEAMTARAIVATLPKLTEQDCRALMAFEAQHKARATVLRAVESRLAA